MGPLTLLALVGLALVVSRAVRVAVAQAFFFTASVVIVTLYVGALVQYLLVPTPAVVEDSDHFLQAADAAGMAFDYVWIAERPSVEAGIGLARFSGGVARAGLYRVRSSIDGKVELVPLVEQNRAC